MWRFLRNNGLSIVLVLIFLVTLAGQSVAGWYEYNETRREHDNPPTPYLGYLSTGHFIEAVFENWESEFLQMAVYIVFTVFLYQKGSAESKDPDQAEQPAETLRPEDLPPGSPWPARRGGWLRALYGNSLGIAFGLLFAASLLLHAYGGWDEYNSDQLEHGSSELVSFVGYMGTSRFWFESLQNWQSEFIAIAAMVLLSVFLRQAGSPESKPIDAPHSQTGAG